MYFLIGITVKNVLYLRKNGGVNVYLNRKLHSLKYADDIVLLHEADLNSLSMYVSDV